MSLTQGCVSLHYRFYDASVPNAITDSFHMDSSIPGRGRNMRIAKKLSSFRVPVARQLCSTVILQNWERRSPLKKHWKGSGTRAPSPLGASGTSLIRQLPCERPQCPGVLKRRIKAKEGREGTGPLGNGCNGLGERRTYRFGNITDIPGVGRG